MRGKVKNSWGFNLIIPIAIVVGFFIFLFQPRQAYAFGLSPGVITVENMGRNMKTERHFILVRRNPSQTDYFRVTVSGEGARYIELTNNGVAELPQGQTEANYFFIINSAKAANGTYEAVVQFLPDDTVGAGGAGKQNTQATQGLSFKVGAAGKVRFTVTDQEIKTFTIDNVFLQDSEVGMPVGIRFRLANTGNVDVHPDLITLEMVEDSDPTYVVTGTISGIDLPLVAPLETKEITSVFKQTFEQGAYRGTVRFVADGKTIFTRDNFRLQIFPLGSLAQQLELADVRLNGETFAPNDLVKFDVIARNSGAALVNAHVVVEISRDEKLLELLRSDKVTIVKGDTTQFTLTYRQTEEGTYQARVYAEYGAKKTSIQERTFVVRVPGWAGRIGRWFVVILGALLITGIILVVVGRFLIAKGRSSSPGPTGSVPGDPPSLK